MKKIGDYVRFKRYGSMPGIESMKKLYKIKDIRENGFYVLEGIDSKWSYAPELFEVEQEKIKIKLCDLI